jgi:hypothetical protein
MALKKCKECQKEISTSAKTCPHCGKKRPTGGLAWLAKIFLIIVGLAILGNIIGRFNQDKPDSNQNTESATVPKENNTGKSSVLYKMVYGEKQDSKPQNKIYKENEWTDSGSLSYCVFTSAFGKEAWPEKKPQNIFLIIELTIKNKGEQSSTIPPIVITNSTGTEYGRQNWDVKSSMKQDEIAGGQSQHGLILFDVPSNDKYFLKARAINSDSTYTLIELSPSTRLITQEEPATKPKFVDAVKVLQLYIDNPIEFEANMIGQRFATRGYVVNIVNSCVWLGDKNAIQTVKHPTAKWDITLQVKPIISCLLQNNTNIDRLKIGDVAIFSGVFNSYQISENNPGIMILTDCTIEK